MLRQMSVELVNDGGKHAVCISIDDKSVILQTNDVDGVIDLLSRMRTTMRPEIPKEPSRTQQYVVEMDPCWHAEPHPFYDGVVLIFRHRGLGWAGFALPRHSLEKLCEAMTQQVETIATDQGLLN